MLLAIPAWGQWEYGGKQIGFGQPEVYPCLAPDGSGGVFVAWQGCTDALDSSYIMLNHFNALGTAIFGEAVIVARSPLNNYGEPQIAPDGLGGCFVVWTQGPINGWGAMYLQRIGFSGGPLWPENKRLTYRSGDAYPFRGGLQLLADTSFGAIAVCVFDTGSGGYGLLGQRVDYEGNILWDSVGIHVLDFIPEVWRYLPAMPKLCKSGNGFYCTWIDLRGNQNNIYAQRFDIFGNIYFGPGGMPISTSGGGGDTFARQSLQIVPDGSGGIIVGWKYNRSQLKAQRISSQGNPYWQINGIQILPFASNSGGLGLYPIGQKYMAITTDHIEGHYEIFDLSGNLEYGGQGRIFGQNIIYASAFKNNVLYFLKRIPNQWYYYGSKGDTLNYEYWPNLPFVHEGVDHGYQVLPDGLGGLYVVLSDYRNWNTDWVILQRIYPDGYIGGDTVGISNEEPPLLPKALSLEAYPNPFNSTVNISFNMPASGEAKITIFDDLGRVVDIIKLENLSLGQQLYTWNYQNRDFKLASGAYFITVQTSGYRESCAITLLK
jgi:hypothetical protein